MDKDLAGGTGSILGPLLFLIYNDDIINEIEHDMYLYAGDTSLLEVITDPVLSFEKIIGI